MNELEGSKKERNDILLYKEKSFLALEEDLRQSIALTTTTTLKKDFFLPSACKMGIEHIEMGTGQVANRGGTILAGVSPSF